jgi:hypothetical protein
MPEFNPIEGRVLIVSAGTYKPAPLYEYGGAVYAKYGQGYIALKANGDTSKNKVWWKDIELELETRNHIGKLVLVNRPVSVAAE